MVQDNFKPDDNAHYLFCPRNLNSMVDSLEHYQIDMAKADEVLQAMRNEAVKQFEDRLVNADEKARFRKLLLPIFGPPGEIVFTMVDNKLKSVQQKDYR